MPQCSFFNVIVRSLPQCALPNEISKFSPNTVQSQLLSSAECSKHPTSYYLTIFTSQGCTFPQPYLLFQTDVHALPVNLHNCFPSCLVCLSVSQFLSPTDSFILSCLQVGLNVSDLLFPTNSFTLSCLSRDHSASDFLSTTHDFILS